MSKVYDIVIELRGCDDTTRIPLEVLDHELEFLKRISRLSKKMSSYKCQPVLDIEIDVSGDLDETEEAHE